MPNGWKERGRVLRYFLLYHTSSSFTISNLLAFGATLCTRQQKLGAAITRIVTWAKFRDKATRKTFFSFNTHFDHLGKVARRESATLLLKKIREIAGSSVVILTGDFNAVPTDEPIQVISKSSDPLHLTDTKELSRQPHYRPTGTLNGFKAKETNNDPIDYIFINKGIKVLQYATLS